MFITSLLGGYVRGINVRQGKVAYFGGCKVGIPCSHVTSSPFLRLIPTTAPKISNGTTGSPPVQLDSQAILTSSPLLFDEEQAHTTWCFFCCPHHPLTTLSEQLPRTTPLLVDTASSLSLQPDYRIQRASFGLALFLLTFLRRIQSLSRKPPTWLP